MRLFPKFNQESGPAALLLLSLSRPSASPEGPDNNPLRAGRSHYFIQYVAFAGKNHTSPVTTNVQQVFAALALLCRHVYTGHIKHKKMNNKGKPGATIICAATECTFCYTCTCVKDMS